MHVYEDRFALVPQATFKPPHAPLADYLEVRRLLGLTRAVVVQPNGYGFDNTCTLEALAGLGDTARGIATVPSDVACRRSRCALPPAARRDADVRCARADG